MSPTTIFFPAASASSMVTSVVAAGRVYPGYGTGWVAWEGYTGYYPGTLQDPELD